MNPKTTIYDAAQALQKALHAPIGAVNTTVSCSGTRKVIRVLVDPKVLLSVPHSFMGFRVIVENREQTIAFDSTRRSRS
jgi:hypothetical protein